MEIRPNGQPIWDGVSEPSRTLESLLANTWSMLEFIGKQLHDIAGYMHDARLADDESMALGYAEISINKIGYTFDSLAEVFAFWHAVWLWLPMSPRQTADFAMRGFSARIPNPTPNKET